MAFRNRVSSKGFSTTQLGSGFDELQIDSTVLQTQPPRFSVSSGSVTVNIADPVTLLKNGVTGVLPSLANHLVGQMFVVALTTSVAGAPGQAQLSGTNTINGGAWTRFLTGSNVVWAIAAKTPANTFNWIVASGSAL